MAQSACNSDQLQICGHHGALTASASTGRLWKQTTAAEVAAYQALQSDPLGPFLPRLYSWKETSLELEDLRASFGPDAQLRIVDLKLGTRTWRKENEADDRLREDYLQKLERIAPSSVSEADRQVSSSDWSKK